MKMLGDLDNVETKAADGGGEMKKNYFDHIVEQITKQIDDLMAIAKNTLSLPQKYTNKQKEGT